MESVNKEWLDSIGVVKQLFNQLEPSYGSRVDAYVLGQIKHVFEDYFRNGLVIDTDEAIKKLDNYVVNLDRSFAASSQYEKYKKALVDVNYQTRKKTFMDYVEMDDESLEQIRLSDIEAYKDLIGKLKSYSSDQMGPDYSTSSIESMLNVNSSEIRSNYRVPFDNAYDVIYAYYQSTYSSNQVSGRTHEEYIKYLQDVLDKLNSMTPDEFKNYKIELLKLNDEEVKKIEEEVSRDLEKTISSDKEVEIAEKVEEDVSSITQEVVSSVPTGESFEAIEETVPSFATILMGKMGSFDVNCPSEMKTSIIEFLSNVCEFDITSPTNLVTNVYEQQHVLQPYGKVLSGKVHVWDSEIESSRAVDYYVSKNGQNSELYDFTMNSGDSRYSFQYNSLAPERGVSMQVHKHKPVNIEPRFGIKGIEYSGAILSDGSISAQGITTEVPSMYEQNGQVRKVSNKKTGDFTCLSYEELANVTNQALGLNKEQNQTLK